MKPSRVNQKVIPIRPRKDRNHRVRMIANPNDPRTVDVLESLLSKCEMSRCESSTEDGVTTWSMIVTEDLLDEALDSIAVTVPIDYELFKNEEGHLYIVTNTEWYRLGGVAEDTANCWEGDDFDDFEGEVTQELRNLIQAELENLPWTGDKTGDEILGSIEDRVMAEMDVYTWSEEEVHHSVQAAYVEATKSIDRMEE